MATVETIAVSLRLDSVASALSRRSPTDRLVAIPSLQITLLARMTASTVGIAVENSFADYLINRDDSDWPEVLTTWAWLLPPEFMLWLATRFGDLFLVLADAKVHMLDVGAGTLTRVAESQEEFCDLLGEDDNANQWFMIPLVDQLVAAGVVLQPEQCYGFKMPPILGGHYTVENVAPLKVWNYLGSSGSIHEQLKDVPDGSQVVLKVVKSTDKLCEDDDLPSTGDSGPSY